jgi:hypothetical protein
VTSGSIVFLPLASSSHIHLQRRHTSCRCARPLPVKAGTIPSPQFCHQSRNFRKNWRDFWHAAKLGHGTYYFTSLPKEGILRIFWMPEKCNSFGRVWTRELGFQWNHSRVWSYWQWEPQQVGNSGDHYLSRWKECHIILHLFCYNTQLTTLMSSLVFTDTEINFIYRICSIVDKINIYFYFVFSLGSW